ncbi:MAG: hypothetical protein ACXW2U_02720 [Telluria sp.]
MRIDERIAALECDMSSVKTDLAVIRSNYATKADLGEVKADVAAVTDNLNTLKVQVAVISSNYVPREEFQKAINTLTWKMYGVMTALAASVFFISKNIS